jgi:betaine-aldehyde dehydrogenase
VVFPDADLEAAAAKIAFGAYFNQGECCNAGSRLLVHRDVADELTELVLAKTKEQKVGDPLDEDTVVGSLISDQQLETVESYVKIGREAGATVAAGGNRIPTEHGRFYEPTVLTNVAPDARVAVEEIFGPVLSIVQFGDLAEAVKITNASGYGLSAGVWSSSMTTALEYAKATRAGTVWINCWMEGFPEIPFGGVGASGIGRELGRGAVEDFTETKSVIFAVEPGASGATMVAS